MTMADETKPIYVGTRLKFVVDIVSEGFSMDTDDFKVVIRSTKAEKVIPKSEMLVTEDEKYLFTVDTLEMGTGDYTVSTFAYVPDADFGDGVRIEVTKQLLCVVTS